MDDTWASPVFGIIIVFDLSLLWTELVGLGVGICLKEERTLLLAFSWVRCLSRELMDELTDLASSICFVLTLFVTLLFTYPTRRKLLGVL